MNDETPDPAADVEAEEGEANTGTPPPAQLDVKAIIDEAKTRYDTGVTNGRVDMDTTYAGYVTGLVNASNQALSQAFAAEADRRTADSAMKKGPYNRRRLAVQVASGSYNLPA